MEAAILMAAASHCARSPTHRTYRPPYPQGTDPSDFSRCAAVVAINTHRSMPQTARSVGAVVWKGTVYNLRKRQYHVSQFSWIYCMAVFEINGTTYTYMPNPTHRNMTPNKSQWTVGLPLEVSAFRASIE